MILPTNKEPQISSVFDVQHQTSEICLCDVDMTIANQYSPPILMIRRMNKAISSISTQGPSIIDWLNDDDSLFEALRVMTSNAPLALNQLHIQSTHAR